MRRGRLARARTADQRYRRTGRHLKGQVAQRGSFRLAFAFKAQEGVPPDRRYCLLPPFWRGLPGVLMALSDRQIGEQSVLAGGDGGRAYLVGVQAGVDTRCLLEPE